nr:MAG TPA: hypothetical protein [Bacteriophage sp.]
MLSPKSENVILFTYPKSLSCFIPHRSKSLYGFG